MASETLHEENLSAETLDLHRAIVSLMEELEAVDWYQQRVEATSNEELKSVLAHNRDEEIEHAMMNLEWIRRSLPTFDEAARTYLFTEGPITAVEAAATGEGEGEDEEPAEKARGTGGGSPVANPRPNGRGRLDGSLGIGSLKV